MANKRKFKVYDLNSNEVIICVPDILGENCYPTMQYLVGNAFDLANQSPEIFDVEYTVLTTSQEDFERLSELNFNTYYMSPESRLYFDTYHYLYVDDGKLVSYPELILGVQPFITGLLPSIRDIPSYWMRKIERTTVESAEVLKYTFESIFTTQSTFNRYIDFIESAEEIVEIGKNIEKPMVTKNMRSRSGASLSSINPGDDVVFKYGSKSEYIEVDKEDNVFYYITDTNELYRGSELLATGSSIAYSETLPEADNTDGLLKVIYCETVPEDKYDGYLYLIKEPEIR